MITRELKVEIDKAQVLRQIDCCEDSDFYEEIAEEYDAMLSEIKSLCKPVFLMKKSNIGKALERQELPAETQVLMTLYSIGGEVSKYSTEAFQKGDYVKGMLADAMADSALFSLEAQCESFLKEACAEYQMGISRRLEAPHDISMKAQRIVWSQTSAEKLCGMKISAGNMLDPVKSMAVIYVLTSRQDIFLNQHDCKSCDCYQCKMRKVLDIPVTVMADDRIYFLKIAERESILQALIRENPFYTAVCGGRGTCGKCRIRVLDGHLDVTDSDRKCFSKEELQKGMRLACRAYPTESVVIRLEFKREDSFSVV